MRIVETLFSVTATVEGSPSTVAPVSPRNAGPFNNPAVPYDVYQNLLSTGGSEGAHNAVRNAFPYQPPHPVRYLCTKCDVRWCGNDLEGSNCWVCGEYTPEISYSMYGDSLLGMIGT